MTKSDWQKGSVRRKRRAEVERGEPVEARVFKGVFACHAHRIGKSIWGWDVTHVPSGLSISTGGNLRLRTLKIAKAYTEECYALLPHAQWLLERPGLGTPEIQEAAYQIRNRYREPRR